MDLKETECVMRAGSMWLNAGTSSGF
jgi:hypothetical protein